MLTFPTALFSPSSLAARLVGGAVTGGQSLSGITQFAMTTGGPSWVFEFGEAPLWTKETFNTWEAVAAATDNGATPFVVPVCDRRRQPFVDPKRGEGVGDGDDSTFSDGALWSAEYITASVVGSASLRATRLNISITGIAPEGLVGGEHFTIWHLTKGQRMYRVARVVEQDTEAHTATIDIRPPLREATADGITLDFDNPRCVMRINGDMGAILEMLRFGKSPQIQFVESFAPVEAYV